MGRPPPGSPLPGWHVPSNCPLNTCIPILALALSSLGPRAWGTHWGSPQGWLVSLRTPGGKQGGPTPTQGPAPQALGPFHLLAPASGTALREAQALAPTRTCHLSGTHPVPLMGFLRAPSWASTLIHSQGFK